MARVKWIEKIHINSMQAWLGGEAGKNKEEKMSWKDVMVTREMVPSQKILQTANKVISC